MSSAFSAFSGRGWRLGGDGAFTETPTQLEDSLVLPSPPVATSVPHAQPRSAPAEPTPPALPAAIDDTTVPAAIDLTGMLAVEPEPENVDTSAPMDILEAELNKSLADSLEKSQIMNENTQKIFDGLAKASTSGVTARSPEYSQFMRAVEIDQDLRQQYEQCAGRSEKSDFRKQWASKKLQAMKETMTQSQVLDTIDWSATTYRSLAQLVDIEKDEAVAMNIARTCQT